MFNIPQFIGIILGTLLVFSWIFFLRKHWENKIAYLIIVSFILLYSGIGGSLKQVSKEYVIYYFIYIFILSFSLYLFKGKDKKTHYVDSNKLNGFIERYAQHIILLYIFLHILDLCVPSFVLYRIFNPPSPDVIAALKESLQHLKQTNFIASTNYYILQLLTPFYLVCLYKYRHKIIWFLSFIFIVLYLIYCRDGYIGRGTILLYLILCLYISLKYNPKLRKWVIITCILLTPTLIIFFVNYSRLRLGAEATTIGFGDAFELLLYQETSLPSFFEKYKNSSGELFTSYLHWLISLPLPGFLKFSDSDWAFNAILSEKVLAIPRTANDFSIVLSGVVGESIFIFGKYFFWLHAIIYGLIISKSFSFLEKYDCLTFLYIYTALILGYYIARGGTVSGYPFILKHLLLFYIFTYIYNRYRFKLKVT
jgi:hypothetical protein